MQCKDVCRGMCVGGSTYHTVSLNHTGTDLPLVPLTIIRRSVCNRSFRFYKCKSRQVRRECQPSVFHFCVCCVHELCITAFVDVLHANLRAIQGFHKSTCVSQICLAHRVTHSISCHCRHHATVIIFSRAVKSSGLLGDLGEPSSHST